MKTYRIATIPGDGIGKEVVPAGQKVLEALATASSNFKFEFQNFDWAFRTIIKIPHSVIVEREKKHLDSRQRRKKSR